MPRSCTSATCRHRSSTCWRRSEPVQAHPLQRVGFPEPPTSEVPMSENLNRREALAVAAVGLTVLPAVEAVEKVPENAFTVVVTDPLSAPLACACVKGYAQRDYEKLGKHLETKLGRPVVVVHATSLTKAVT